MKVTLQIGQVNKHSSRLVSFISGRTRSSVALVVKGFPSGFRLLSCTILELVALLVEQHAFSGEN